MAWLSQATTNGGLVDQLIENEVIAAGSEIEKAFRNTDRGLFVNDCANKQQCYNDRPFKNSLVHLSAPHMYCTILDTLSLQHGQSFLNVGSGSGYLSCLASCCLGEGGLSHGIEISR